VTSWGSCALQRTYDMVGAHKSYNKNRQW
jgi:hypothetical protein